MAESTLVLINKLQESIHGFRPMDGRLNLAVIEALFSVKCKQRYTEETTIKMVNSLAFKMRLNGRDSDAKTLEKLTEKVIQAKFIPVNNYKCRKFQDNFEMVTLLVLLENIDFSSPQTPFRSSHLESSTASDLFLHSKDTSERDRFDFIDSFDNAEKLENIGSFRLRNELTPWFSYEPRDLMGAFTHLQTEKNTPFGINLELPSLEETNEINYPLPAFNCETAASLQNLETTATEDKWQGIIAELEENPIGFSYNPGRSVCTALWEPDTEVTIDSLLTMDEEEAESRYLVHSDSYLVIPEPSVSETTFVKILKQLLLSIPSTFVKRPESSYEVSQKFRLQGLNETVTSYILERFLGCANKLVWLSSFVDECTRKKELLTPAFGRAIEKFCTFFYSFAISLPKNITLMELLVQTKPVLDNLQSIHSLCIATGALRGSELIDLLYKVSISNDADIHSSHLLRMVFQKSFKPFLHILNCFVYYGDKEDPYQEFILTDDPAQKDFLGGYFGLKHSYILATAEGYLLNIYKNLTMLKELPVELSSYYNVCSVGVLSTLNLQEPPKLRLLYEVYAIQRQLDRLTEFQASQVRGLMELERIELVQSEQKRKELLEQKLNKLRTHKLSSEAYAKLQQQIDEAKRAKQTQYFNELQAQLNENQELKRIEIEKERKREEEIRQIENEKQKELMEKAKEALYKEYEVMMENLYFKNAKSNWKKMRESLNEKRLKFYKEEEEKIRQFLDNLSQSKEISLANDTNEVGLRQYTEESKLEHLPEEIKTQEMKTKLDTNPDEPPDIVISNPTLEDLADNPTYESPDILVDDEIDNEEKKQNDLKDSPDIILDELEYLEDKDSKNLENKTSPDLKESPEIILKESPDSEEKESSVIILKESPEMNPNEYPDIIGKASPETMNSQNLESSDKEATNKVESLNKEVSSLTDRKEPSPHEEIEPQEISDRVIENPTLEDLADTVHEDKKETTQQKPDELAAKTVSEFPEKVKQPPGGHSTMKELFSYAPEEPVEEIRVFKEDPRISYHYRMELFKIVSDIVYDSILAKVFRKITPKKKWAVSKPEKTDIFRDLLDPSSGSQESTYPLPFLMQKLILDPIKVQSEFIDKVVVHLFLRKLNLLKHLKALKRYAILGAGDTIDLFLETIFNVGFLGNVQSAWEAAIKMTSSKDDPFTDLVSIKDSKKTYLWSQFRSPDSLESLSFSYNIPAPLNVIITPEILKTYSRIFTTLLKIKNIGAVLCSLKLFSQGTQASFRRLYFLRHRMQHFLDIIQGHIASEVHGTAWQQLQSTLKKAEDIEGIIKAHSDYLSKVSKNCFLVGTGNVVMENLETIFSLVMRFHSILIQANFDEPLSMDGMRELSSIETQFNSIHRFLFKMTKAMASKGNYPELFLRLDYNNYLAKKIDRELVS